MADSEDERIAQLQGERDRLQATRTAGSSTSSGPKKVGWRWRLGVLIGGVAAAFIAAAIVRNYPIGIEGGYQGANTNAVASSDPDQLSADEAARDLLPFEKGRCAASQLTYNGVRDDAYQSYRASLLSLFSSANGWTTAPSDLSPTQDDYSFSYAKNGVTGNANLTGQVAFGTQNWFGVTTACLYAVSGVQIEDRTADATNPKVVAVTFVSTKTPLPYTPAFLALVQTFKQNLANTGFTGTFQPQFERDSAPEEHQAVFQRLDATRWRLITIDGFGPETPQSSQP